MTSPNKITITVQTLSGVHTDDYNIHQKLQKVVEVGHTQRASPLQEGVKDVCRGPGVLEGTVVGGGGGAEMGGQALETEVAHLLSDETSGEGSGVG